VYIRVHEGEPEALTWGGGRRHLDALG
jgi:hypothetical protein